VREWTNVDHQSRSVMSFSASFEKRAPTVPAGTTNRKDIMSINATRSTQSEFDNIVLDSLTTLGPRGASDALTDETARKFFGTLYEDGEDASADWSSAVTPLVAKMGDNVVAGDQALQSLMVNFVLNNADSIDQVKGMSAALAGIKQLMVTEIVKEFPHSSIEELIAAARESGYDVQVLTA
jgi:hypothetical protein